ncbi:MAG TPA: ShlB/FhaC/HecB family hemolysin secretion/activation protein, partial [Dongiaceae bacterium]|nr:ShlB/FhaC/HecB family hemolysin secretion/activation protein [Dongiaceae bacterium]
MTAVKGKRSIWAGIIVLARPGVLVLLGLLSFSAGAFAQANVNRLPGVIDRPTPSVNLPPPPRPLPPLVGKPSPATVPNANAPIPTLTQIVFSGNTVISTARLDKVAAGYLHRKLTVGDLAQLKYDITRVYYEDGYILVRVVTPPQDLTKGVLKIDIYEAKIEKIENNKGIVAQFIVDGITSEITPGSVFNETDVESMVRDLDDLPGVAAAVDLKPGAQIGTTDLDIALKQVKDFQQSVSVNNYGSKLTGQWLFNGNFQYGNLLGLGERYVLNVTGSNDTLFTIQGGIQTPIGIRNIILDTSYLYSNSDIGNAFATLGQNGQTKDFKVGLSSALLNTAKQKISVRAGFDARHLVSTILNGTTTQSDDQIRQFTIDGTYLLRLQDTTLFTDLQYAQGCECLGASPQGDPNASVKGGDPAASIFRGTLFVRQNLWTDGSLKGLLTGQYAGDTLLASDLFSIGGYGSVRGFQPAQSTGNSGLQTSIELDQTVWHNEMW